MKIIADMHTHTISSHHAFSTLAENCTVAKERGLTYVALTNHAPAMEDGANIVHFLAAMPRYSKGVRVISGVELNILGDYIEPSPYTFPEKISEWRNFGGNGFDLPDWCIARLEYVIASIHDGCVTPSTVEEHTRLIMRALDNPHIDCLGHLGNPRYLADYESIVKKCAETGKTIEINSHSPSARKGSAANCEQIAKLCMQYGVPVMLSTDTHYMEEIGDFSVSLGILEKAGFPEEMVINADEERFKAWFRLRKGIVL